MDVIHLGLGMKGRHWLEIVREHPDVTPVGCVDPDTTALDWVKTHFPGIYCCASLSDALQHVKAEAVIITSPPAFHASQAIEALEAGLGVMLETPFATTLAEGVQIVRTARCTGQALMVAQNHRFARCEQTLRRLLHAGKVGTVTHVSCTDRRTCPPQRGVLAGAEYTQILNVGAHHFDSLRSMLGVNPVRVMARCGKAPWSEYRHGSTTEAFVEMEHNINVQYYGSLTSSRHEHALWIEGDQGVLWTDRRHIWWRQRGWRFFIPIRAHKVPPGDAMKYPREGTATLLQQFQAAVHKGQLPETHGEDNLQSLSMVEAVMLSDTTGKTIHIAELFAAAGMPVPAAVTAQKAQL
jgi:predicted dehydrogenase